MTDKSEYRTPPMNSQDALSRLSQIFGGGGAAGAFGHSNGNLSGLLTGLLGNIGGTGSGKSKKGPQSINSALPSLDKVPTATGGYYQQSDPAARQQMLATMIARAKQPTGMFPGTPPAQGV